MCQKSEYATIRHLAIDASSLENAIIHAQQIRTRAQSESRSLGLARSHAQFLARRFQGGQALQIYAEGRRHGLDSFLA